MLAFVNNLGAWRVTQWLPAGAIIKTINPFFSFFSIAAVSNTFGIVGRLILASIPATFGYSSSLWDSSSYHFHKAVY